MAGEYTVIASLSSDGGKSTTVSGQDRRRGRAGTDRGDANAHARTDQGARSQARRRRQKPTATPEPDADTGRSSQGRSHGHQQRAQPARRAGHQLCPVGQVQRNDKLEIMGKNPESTWIKIVAPNGTEAWVILTYVDINVSLDDVALAEVPPAPTAAPRPTQPPAPNLPAPSGTGFGYGVQAHAFNDLDQGRLLDQRPGL